jgi:hypothetical protein
MQPLAAAGSSIGPPPHSGMPIVGPSGPRSPSLLRMMHFANTSKSASLGWSPRQMERPSKVPAFLGSGGDMVAEKTGVGPRHGVRISAPTDHSYRTKLTSDIGGN